MCVCQRSPRTKDMNKIANHIMRCSPVAVVLLWLLVCCTGRGQGMGFGNIAYTGAAGAFNPLSLNPYYLFVSYRVTAMTSTGPDVPAVAGQAVVAWRDISGNARDGTQGTAADQPLFTTGSAVDFVDTTDLMQIASYGVAGTMVVGTEYGVIFYEVNSTAFTDFSALGRRAYPSNPAGEMFVFGMFPTLTAGQKAQVEAYCVSRGAAASVVLPADLTFFWRDRNEITSFPLLGTGSVTVFSYAWGFCTGLTSFPMLDVSSGTSFFTAWQGCSGLTTFPLLDTSSGTNFGYAWNDCTGLVSFPSLNLSSATYMSRTWKGCSSLTTFPANMFDACIATDYYDAFLNCALTQTSVDNILISIDTAGQSGGTLNMTGGTSAAPSAAGVTAKNNLIGRGWTVTTN